jgi:hypothetical protein
MVEGFPSLLLNPTMIPEVKAVEYFLLIKRDRSFPAFYFHFVLLLSPLISSLPNIFTKHRHFLVLRLAESPALVRMPAKLV